MKVVLINPDYMIYGDPPLGLAYLASYAKKIFPDIDIKIYDQIPLKKILSNVRKDKPDVIGITAVTLSAHKAKNIAKKIKAISSKTILVWGGVHLTTSPKSFENSVFDIGVLGEGEIPFTQLLKHIRENNGLNIKKLSQEKGFLLRIEGQIKNTGISEQIQDLDQIPPPARNLLRMDYYSIPSFSSGFVGGGSIITSRGCPFNCIFCSTRCLWGPRVRFFSAKRVADDMEFQYRKYGFKVIEIYDDLFSLNTKRLREIIALLKEKKILGKIDFFCMGTTKGFTEEIASLLKQLNVKQITFGFESGSEKMLKNLKRGLFTIEDSIKAIEICKKFNLDYSGFFMVGSPDETEEDMTQTYDFIKKYCAHDFIAYQTIPFPGTDVWNYAVKNQIIDENMYEDSNKEFIDTDASYLLTKNISKERFTQLFKKINSLKVKQRQNQVVQAFRKRPVKIFGQLFNPMFLRKAYSLRRAFVRRVFGK